MRLIQLARELNISPGVLEERLKALGSNSEVNSNMRLEESTVLLLVSELAPGRLEEFKVTQVDAPETESAAAPEVTPLPSIVEPASGEHLDRERASVDSDPESVALPDVIRAPKVELPGLKVVGKIELPEPPKKPEPPQPSADDIPSDQPPGYSRSDRNLRGRRERRPHRDDNPVARERERQQRLAEKQRQEEIRKKKELRTRAYEQGQARRQLVSGRKKKKSSLDSSNGQTRQPRPQPKSWFGRFWRWLAHGE